MNKILKYNLFESTKEMGLKAMQSEFSIYSFYDKCSPWTKNGGSEFLKWTDHFIGDGFYEKIRKRSDQITDVIKSIDKHNINARLNDIRDDLEISIEIYIGFTNYDGTHGFSGTSYEKSKSEISDYIMKRILAEIIRPTIEITRHSSKTRQDISLRPNNMSKYVVNKEYQCVNFFNSPTIQSITNEYMYGTEIKKLEKWDIDKFYQNFLPAVYFAFGDRRDHKEKFSYRELEAKINNLLPALQYNLDIEETYYDNTRIGELDKRTFDMDIETNDYSLKFVLKL